MRYAIIIDRIKRYENLSICSAVRANVNIYDMD